MIQNIIVLIIVGLVLLKTIYSVYKAVTTKDKSLCGGCASCDLKHELKKKGMLMSYADKKAKDKMNYSTDALKYTIRKT
ncbi:MAG: FeoB-associated Cys-rich membrane protein [Candidatus Saccharibacteria bacterium]